MSSIQQLLQKDIIQSQLAKSLEVAERLYDILVEKPEIIIYKEVTLPAGAGDQDIAEFDFTNTKYEGNYVNIQVIAATTNCTIQVIYDFEGIRTTQMSFYIAGLESDSFIALRGMKIVIRVAYELPTNPASAKVIVAVKKVLPVTTLL